MQILVVDDEKDVRELFLQRFRKERRNGDLEMHFAFSAEEALNLLEKTNAKEIRVIFSDINMPGINGLELLKIIRNRFEGIKVVMVSAYGNENYYETAMLYGADDYLVKPIDFQMLKEKYFNE